MTVRREHLTFSKILSHFLPTLCNAKMENMQTAVAVKKVWLLCENSAESLPRHSESCSWPAQPSSVLPPKLWEWPSGGLLVLLIGVSTEHSNPPPYSLPPHTHYTGGWLGQREEEIAGACVVWNLDLKTELRNTEFNLGCTERKTVRVDTEYMILILNRAGQQKHNVTLTKSKNHMSSCQHCTV